MVTYVYLDEAEIAFNWLMCSDTDKKPDLAEQKQALNNKFLNTPLKAMQPAEKNDLHSVILKAADVTEEIISFIKL